MRGRDDPTMGTEQPVNIVETAGQSTPGRSRTGDQQFRKLLLYPTELRGRVRAQHRHHGPKLFDSLPVALARQGQSVVTFQPRTRSLPRAR